MHSNINNHWWLSWQSSGLLSSRPQFDSPNRQMFSPSKKHTVVKFRLLRPDQVTLFDIWWYALWSWTYVLQKLPSKNSPQRKRKNSPLAEAEISPPAGAEKFPPSGRGIIPVYTKCESPRRLLSSGGNMWIPHIHPSDKGVHKNPQVSVSLQRIK